MNELQKKLAQAQFFAAQLEEVLFDLGGGWENAHENVHELILDLANDLASPQEIV